MNKFYFWIVTLLVLVSIVFLSLFGPRFNDQNTFKNLHNSIKYLSNISIDPGSSSGSIKIKLQPVESYSQIQVRPYQNTESLRNGSVKFALFPFILLGFIFLGIFGEALIERWRQYYKVKRPLSSLNCKPPEPSQHVLNQFTMTISKSSDPNKKSEAS